MLKYIKIDYHSVSAHTIKHIKIQNNVIWFTSITLKGYGVSKEFREWRKSSVDAEEWSLKLWNIVSKWHSSKDREERARKIMESVDAKETTDTDIDSLFFSPYCDYYMPYCDGRGYDIEFLFDEDIITYVVMSNNYPDDFDSFQELIIEVLTTVCNS